MRFRTRLTLFWAVAFCWLAWTGVRAEAPTERSAADIVRSFRSLAPTLSAQQSPIELWGHIVGPDPLPVRCATPLSLALHLERPHLSSHARSVARSLLATPQASDPFILAEGLEWRTVRDARRALSGSFQPTATEAIELASLEAGRALALWVDDMGWLPPVTASSGAPLTVYISADLPAGADGMALLVSEPEHTFEEDAAAVILLSPRLLRHPERLQQALIHQLAHTVLWSYSHREALPWQEASAVALEVEARRDIRPYLDHFNERLQRRSTSLLSDDLRLSQGSGLWALFLDLSRPVSGPILRRLWEELAAVPGDNLAEAAESTFAALDRSDLGSEITTYLAWGMFTANDDDGRHFPFAETLAPTQADTVHASYPSQGPAGSGVLEPWSGHVIRLLPGAGPGGTRLEFQGDDRGRWTLLALFEGRNGGPLYSAEIPVDSDGRATLTFPWQAISRASLAVAYVSARGSEAGTFSYSVWHDPAYPYELAGLQAEPSPAGVVLNWITQSESDLAAWNLYRSRSPLTGYVRINQVPILAGGDTMESLRYVYRDGNAEPGRKYYYYLEGLTIGGFAERSPGISIRIPESAQRH